MGTARARLTPCPFKPSERAAMLAAVEQISRALTRGVTPEQVAQARAELQALNTPRQPQLPLKLCP